MDKRKLVVRGCMGLVVLSAVLIGLLLWAMFGDQSRYITGAASHEFAPATVNSIDYFQNKNITGTVCVSYVVAEDDFRKFAATKGWALVPRSEEFPIVVNPAPAQWAARRPNEGRIKVHFCFTKIASAMVVGSQ